ncbi:hypothetical protein THRCLA_23341 [Thraustotheca clavata]|uniref:Ribonuclease P/MRP protein subunit POP5 n=1 Tax=Thraustotheca clavata TaxID=74557 RepID=A0A1V9Y7A6_9STRA|nr:hypothetical protein THRCLA_23341 [Thraustotheca clavata]
MVRFKNRYFIVDVAFARGKKLASLTARDVYTVVLQAIGSNYGDYGVGIIQSSLQVVYYNAITQLAVVRCARDHATQVQACLTFITEVLHQDVKFRTVHVCGSNRTLKDTMLELSRERIRDHKLDTTHPTIENDVVNAIAIIEAQ